MFPFKHTPLNAWSPLDEDGIGGGTIRLYDASVTASVTSASSATRVRTGVQSDHVASGTTLSTTITSGAVSPISVTVGSLAPFGTVFPFRIKIDDEVMLATSAAGTVLTATRAQNSTAPAAHTSGAIVYPVPMDGQGFVELASGRFLLLGGAPYGYAQDVVNTIWYSDDRGKTWGRLLDDGNHPGWSDGYTGNATHSTATDRPEPGHTFGCFTLTIAGVEYVYWIGGDPFLPTGKVWRSSNGGTTWALVSTAPHTACPTTALALFMYGMIGTDIYIIGGQVSINNGAKSAKVHKSTDGGATWSEVSGASDANFPATVWGDQLQRLPEKDGKLWICGSGRYDDSGPHDYSNAVYTFDGTTWTSVLANGHAQFPKSRYHSCVVDGAGRLWRFNGTTWDGAVEASDSASAHYSTNDGVTWNALSTLAWGATHAQAAIATADGIYLTHGFQSHKLFAVRAATGSLVSKWEDLHTSSTVDLNQSVDAKKPVLVAGVFGSKPGIVADRGQIMELGPTPGTSTDVAITDGGFEIWAIVKSLNFDEGTDSCILVGNSGASCWNNFGLTGGKPQFRCAGPAKTITATTDPKVNDDAPHLIGMQFYPGAPSTVKLFVDGVEVAATEVGAGTLAISADYTGWNAIFGGTAGVRDGSAAAAMGALVIRRGASAAWDSTKIAELLAWSKSWGV